ncbi:MAG: hypothetical protein NTW12_08265 [Deltaproteobacteria bacterium]|nr:hypothetical protein [Deltaproteobacteria bacterium]
MADLIGSLLYFHAGFMLAGFFSMMSGATVAMFLRRKRWWLRFHKAAGILGAVSVLFGFAAVISMITFSGGEHFGGTHTYIGAVTGVVAFITPLLGILQFKVQGYSVEIRVMHRWSGRFVLLFAVITIISGLRLVGIV